MKCSQPAEQPIYKDRESISRCDDANFDGIIIWTFFVVKIFLKLQQPNESQVAEIDFLLKSP